MNPVPMHFQAGKGTIVNLALAHKAIQMTLTHISLDRNGQGNPMNLDVGESWKYLVNSTDDFQGPEQTFPLLPS